MTAWLSIIGVGDDGLQNLKPAAQEALDQASLIIGGDRHLAMLPDDGREQKTWPSPLMQMVEEILARRGEPTCILATGDPMHFGIGVTFAKHLPPEEIAVYPAPSAFSLAAARLGWDLATTEMVTLHGRPLASLISHLAPDRRILALSDNGKTPAEVSALLISLGYEPSDLTVLEHMGGPEEDSHKGKATDFTGSRFKDFNTIAIQCRAASGTRVFSTAPGLPDDAYVHDGQLTKKDIRAATISALEPLPGQLLWDIGAGSGSIGIEWMRAVAQSRAIAIECASDRINLIEQNRRALGVPELKIIEGKAPDACAGLAEPDAVFIGGGILSEGIFETCWSALKPRGRIVINTVTVEGEHELFHLHREYGGNLSRLNISHASAIGRFTSWKPLRQVTQYKLVKS
ncbi:MAG: precorrin-6y C5,15-methyltransferase (decarboxylating) subunit CbiE [Proteobacteria bacterium]|nr:precorrin-6y C5,15-methyltransferase (decarboxylating) subunit CbiE [Pseudomonadota bacterium]